VIVYNDAQSSRLIIRHRPHGFVTYNDEPRRRIVVNESHPGVAISERSVTRSRAGGEINVRAGERSRETISGPASKSPSQGSASSTSRQSSSSQAGGETRAPGGAGRQPSTTGQANH
jgi:hypothetical protein